MGKIERIQWAPRDRERLEKLVRDRNTPQKVVWRARIALLAGDGVGAVAVARQVGKSLPSVRRWRRRYASAGVEGLLKDATRPPGRQPLAAETIKRECQTFCVSRVRGLLHVVRGDPGDGYSRRGFGRASGRLREA